MKHIGCCLIFFLFTGGLMASDGHWFLENCEAYLRVMEGNSRVEDEMPTGACLGYVQGFVDTNSVWFKMYPSVKLYCLPETADTSEAWTKTYIQMVKVVNKWLEDNPASLHYNATSSMIFALKQAFPCEE